LSHNSSPFCWLFCKWDLENYLPGWVLNLSSPDLSLSSGQNYRCVLLAPSSKFFILFFLKTGSCYVTQVGLELAILLPLQYWDY
jgi:hypothetical protein